MPELKKIRVREAKPRDIGLFKKLWREFLTEEHERGGIILPTDENVEVYANIFRMYVDPDIPEEAKQDGVVLFISEVGVLMVGESGSLVKLAIGNKIGYLWGSYVTSDQRGKGLGTKLYEEGFKQLKEMGFNAVIDNLVEGNLRGYKNLEKVSDKVDRVPEVPVYVTLA